MPNGRPRSRLEKESRTPSFRCTPSQHKWLIEAQLAGDFPTFTDFIKDSVIRAGEHLLSKPYPPRKIVDRTLPPDENGTDSGPQKKRKK
jgi:hypothetical protein